MCIKHHGKNKVIFGLCYVSLAWRVRKQMQSEQIKHDGLGYILTCREHVNEQKQYLGHEVYVVCKENWFSMRPLL